MKATIEINMDNDAFKESGGADELHRILKRLSDRLAEEYMPFIPSTLRDSNGNKVGTFEIIKS